MVSFLIYYIPSFSYPPHVEILSFSLYPYLPVVSHTVLGIFLVAGDRNPRQTSLGLETDLLPYVRKNPRTGPAPGRAGSKSIPGARPPFLRTAFLHVPRSSSWLHRKGGEGQACPPHPCAMGSCPPFPSSESRLSEPGCVCSLAGVEPALWGSGAAVAWRAEPSCCSWDRH